MPEPTPIEDFLPISERPEVRRALARIRSELRETRPGLENPPPRVHAEALLAMIHRDMEPGEGPILFAAMSEFYVELLVERGWRARPWNTVAAEFRRITTGDRKVYVWVEAASGVKRRLRAYPIPARSSSPPLPKTTTHLPRATAAMRAV